MRKYTKVINFVICGGISAMVEFGVFYLLNNLFETYVAALISFTCGLLSSFLLNRIIVFKSNAKRVGLVTEVVKFFILGLINSQISAFLTVWITDITHDKLIAKIITMFLVAIWNFFIMNYIIFKKETSLTNKPGDKNIGLDIEI